MAFESSQSTFSRFLIYSKCNNPLKVFFLNFESSFLLAIIKPEETRAKQLPTPPNGTAAGKPTTDKAKPKLAHNQTLSSIMTNSEHFGPTVRLNNNLQKMQEEKLKTTENLRIL